MKNLKGIMIALIMCLISLIHYGQGKTHYLKDDIFYTTFESGVGEKIKMEFNIDSNDIVKIQETELFKNWVNATFSNTENAEYIERWKSISHIEIFLMRTTSMASFYAQFELKNRNSYTPINGTSYIYCKDGEITVMFPMKAQNGYGNFIISKAFYTIEFVDGEEKEFNFVSSN